MLGSIFALSGRMVFFSATHAGPRLANFYRHRFSRNPFWKKRGPCKMHVAKHFCLIGSRGIFFAPHALSIFTGIGFVETDFSKKGSWCKMHVRKHFCIIGSQCVFWDPHASPIFTDIGFDETNFLEKGGRCKMHAGKHFRPTDSQGLLLGPLSLTI